ncbi:T-complex protein 1 subunit beta [Fistulifera solaris]|uniref:CCT-beta n=2 Tax=Naviculales TaxID=38748 RepID=A0A1Z5JD19_FISSO|nr:T-complex protein 1 subunit beta [Fistulifera solaris]|eukprot:GAX11782.1 T-complex protein 1 subunit beta [Fistulifera solaris]
MEQAYISEGTSIDKGENARLSSFVGAIAIADLIKTTLGPRGLDKILQKVDPSDQSITITNDGATILRSVHVDNAAAKVLVDIAKVQDEQVGDGTTSVAVFAGELLRQAENLVNNRIHPQTICDGWRLARETARRTLEEAATNSSEDTDAFRKELMEIAQTTLSSKMLTFEKAHYAKLAVDAVLRLKGSNNLDHIQVLKKPGGSLRDSYLEEGFLLDGKSPGVGQPRRIEKAKILLANTSMDTDKIKIYGSRVKVDSMDKVAAIEQAEKEKMRRKVEKIVGHGISCFINRQLIYNYPESLFASAGVMAIEHADFDGIERLAAVLGGEVVSTFDRPDLVTLGECDIIEEVMIGDDKVLRFGGCKSGEACSIVLRGASSHLLDEAERSLHDALAILIATVKEPRTVYGGGCTEVMMAAAVDRAAQETPGKKALAMTAFATALRQLPTIVADNGGYDAAELVTELQAAHAAGISCSGLDMDKGCIGDMKELGIRESFASKLNVVMSASEAAEMILRVDDIIKAAPRQRSEMGY